MLLYLTKIKQIDFTKLVNDKNLDLLRNLPVNSFQNDIHKLFLKACEKGHLRVVKWLIQLGIEQQNPINIHVNDEFAFKYSCYRGRLEVAKWLVQLGVEQQNPFNIHVNNEEAFGLSCCNGHLEVAKWLVSLSNKYFLEILNDKIIKWHIINQETEILDSLDNNYESALNKLNITIQKSGLHKEMCLICLDKPEKLIILPCNHYYCLESLLYPFKINTATEIKICNYCKMPFEWDQCISYLKN